MRNCIRIPRIFIPREGFQQWSVIACDQHTSDRGYWERVAREVGDAPSTLRLILPEVYLGEDDEERIKQIHEQMYEALESEQIVKLNRGLILVERTTASGVRRGIVAAIDLEAYTTAYGESSPIRPSEEVVPSRLPPRIAVRRGAPLEFPHAIVFYRDKKNKVMRELLEEELEKLYDFELMEGGGHLKGYFIPEFIAADVAQELHTRGEPCFAVADGNHSVAAAKAYWEEIKPKLTAAELRNHPARFTLVELVNVYDPAVVFHPIHRLVKGVEREAFCDYFTRAVKCRREGGVLYPALPAGAAGVQKTDELVENFVRINGGSVDYIHGEEDLIRLAAEEDRVGIALKAIDKDDFFPRLKKGVFPKKTFSLGEGSEKRYYLEGREISYD